MRIFPLFPLFRDYPWNSPYASSENRVIDSKELEGAEKYDYRLSLTSQGKTEMKLVKTTNIVDKVIVGYRTISSGAYFQVPIYETRVNKRQEYTVNNRNTSLNTVKELLGTKTPDPIIKAGMDKITSDYARNKGQFSDNYNVDFGRFMFEQGFKNMNSCTAEDFTKSATEPRSSKSE